MSKIIVIETIERDIIQVIDVASVEEGIRKANELLEAHVASIDRLDDFEDREDEGEEWDFASKDSLNAWCNWRNDNWDAHVVEY